MEESFACLLRTLHLVFNKTTESLELGQTSIAHELESETFAGLNENTIRSQPVESKWNFEGVAGRDTIGDDANFIVIMLYKAESGLKDAYMGLSAG